MGVKRIVDVEFWNDDKVVELFSPEDKLFMLYLMTNPHTTQLGIYSINKKTMAFELGYSLETISVLLDRFENKYNMIKFSNSTNEIAIINYLKYSIIKGGKPVEDCLDKEIKQVKNKELLNLVFTNLKRCDTLNTTIYTILNKYNKYILINDNDNDNEVSWTYRGRIVEDDINIISDEYENIKNKILNDKENNNQICEWCGCKTSVLHKHHFPIPKRYGGKDIVNICSNCHNEFHNLECKENGGILEMNYNNDEKDIFTYIEENFSRTLSPIEYEVISKWKDNDLTRYAIKQTVLSGIYNIKYIQSILDNYEKNNITTVQQAQERDKKFKESKEQKKEQRQMTAKEKRDLEFKKMVEEMKEKGELTDED